MSSGTVDRLGEDYVGRLIPRRAAGVRFFDLRRWGTVAAEINGFINGIGGGAEKNRRAFLLGRRRLPPGIGGIPFRLFRSH